MIRMGVSECFFWYRPTRDVPDQRPLNGRCCCCRGVQQSTTPQQCFCLSGACVYSKIFRHFSLTHLQWAETHFSKNANNVVISSPRVIIFSYIVDFVNLIRYIRSRDHNYFRFGRQGAPKNFFSNSIFSATLYAISEIFFTVVCVPTALLKFRESRSSGVKLGGQAPEVNFFVFSFFEKTGRQIFKLMF